MFFLLSCFAHLGFSFVANIRFIVGLQWFLTMYLVSLWLGNLQRTKPARVTKIKMNKNKSVIHEVLKIFCVT